MQIEQINRFPLKGFYGQTLDEGVMSERGMLGDRRFGVYHPQRVINRSPAGWSPKVNYLQMVFEAFLGGYACDWSADGTSVTLTVEGQAFGPFDLTLEAGRAGLSSQIRALGHLVDEGPLEIVEGQDQNLTDRKVPCITIANPASLADLEAKLGRPLDRERFRMNVWLEGLEAWAEHELVGKTLRLGTLEVEVLERVDRCRAINLTPGQMQWNGDDINVHMKRIYGHHDLGILCSCKTPGRFKIGDPIEVL